MSARAHEVPPDEDDEEPPDEKTEVMEDVSFSTSNNEEYPIMAQIEILYTISQTFTEKKIGYMNMNEGKEHSERNDNDGTLSPDKEYTLDTTHIAVFEGWIEGKYPLQWKLVHNYAMPTLS